MFLNNYLLNKSHFLLRQSIYQKYYFDLIEHYYSVYPPDCYFYALSFELFKDVKKPEGNTVFETKIILLFFLFIHVKKFHLSAVVIANKPILLLISLLDHFLVNPKIKY